MVDTQSKLVGGNSKKPKIISENSSQSDRIMYRYMRDIENHLPMEPYMQKKMCEWSYGENTFSQNDFYPSLNFDFEIGGII